MILRQVWYGTFIFHKLSFPVKSLWHTISHDDIVILKNGVHGEWPRVPSLDTKNILQGNRLLVGLIHGVGSLFLESIDSTNTRHQSIANIHQHTRGEEESSNAQEGHDANKMQNKGMESAIFVGTEKVVPSEQGERICCAGPSIDKEKEEMLCFVVVGSRETR